MRSIANVLCIFAYIFSNMSAKSHLKVLKVDARLEMEIAGFVTAGFPSPAGDYIESALNLTDILVRNESSTFFVRVEGNSMIGASIYDGDILVVDKSLKPEPDSILVCFVDGEFTVKRVNKIDGQLYLVPDNPDYPLIPINENSDFRLWGVVTHSIHNFLKNARAGRRK
jgi:DNA polymerase V